MKLGDEVESILTGYRGIVVAITTRLHASTRICVQNPQLTDEGNERDEIWFDQGHLVAANGEDAPGAGFKP